MSRQSDDRERRREARRQKAKEKGYGGGGGNYLKLPDGMDFFKEKEDINYIDLLQYIVNSPTNDRVIKGKIQQGELYYMRTIHVHFKVGPAEIDLLCPKTVGERCPVCEDAIAIKEDKNSDSNLAKPLWPKLRELYIVDDEHKGIMVWDISWHNFGKQLEKDAELKEEYLDFPELQGGYTLAVRFDKTPTDTFTYLKATRVDFEKRDDYKDDILQEVPDLDALLVVLPYDEIERIHHGRERDDGDAAAPPETTTTEGFDDRDKPPATTRRHRTPRTETDADTPDAAATPPPPKYLAIDLRQMGEAENTEGLLKINEDEGLGIKDEDHETWLAYAEALIEALGLNRAAATTSAPPRTTGAPLCPGGGTIGVDIDKLDHCMNCEVWDDCRDVKDRAAEEKQKGGDKAATSRRGKGK
jgi:hypothetical protein